MEKRKMSTRIAINGFGRMGRLALRAAWGWPEFEFVHINEVKGGAATAAHLLEFDSVHGRWDRAIRAGEKSIEIEGGSPAAGSRGPCSRGSSTRRRGSSGGSG